MLSDNWNGFKRFIWSNEALVVLPYQIYKICGKPVIFVSNCLSDNEEFLVETSCTYLSTSKACFSYAGSRL